MNDCNVDNVTIEPLAPILPRSAVQISYQIRTGRGHTPTPSLLSVDDRCLSGFFQLRSTLCKSFLNLDCASPVCSWPIHGRPQAWAREGHLPLPLEMLKCFLLLQMLSKTLEDKVFVHHFEKMPSASWSFALRSHQGEIPLNSVGGLPSFRPPHCPPMEKNPAGAHGASGPLSNPGTYQYILDLCCGMRC